MSEFTPKLPEVKFNKNGYEIRSDILGLANKLVIEEYKATKTELTGKAPAGGAPAAQQAAPIKVTSKEQFAALPSGTTFVAPDGSVRTKP